MKQAMKLKFGAQGSCGSLRWSSNSHLTCHDVFTNYIAAIMMEMIKPSYVIKRILLWLSF